MMYRRVIAFDYDNTLAEHGMMPHDLQEALKQVHAAGYVLFLVTGRRLGEIFLGNLANLFAGIVWENGAVLSHTASGEVYLPFGALDPRLIQDLVAADIPLERGQAIVATWIPHADTVWQVIQHWGADASLVQNKGALMILPPGATKGTGLERMLGICGLSRHHVVAFGDAENDVSLLECSTYGIAVADAIPALKEAADLVTGAPGPQGVLEALTRYWIEGRPLPAARRRQPQIRLGTTEAGLPVAISGPELISGNLGIFGDSGSGKSWVTGLLAEGMHLGGYQTLLIDPEGDFHGLRGLPGIIVIDGTAQTLPAPMSIVTLLEVGSASIVLDLSSYPMAKRDTYVTELLRQLQALRLRTFRPHWIVLEEAQYFVRADQLEALEAIQPLLTGGWVFVSYRPDMLAPTIRAALRACLLTRLTSPEAIAAVRPLVQDLRESPATIPPGHVWMWERSVVKLRPYRRRIPHIRHLHKYLNAPLPPHKRFVFNTPQGATGITAASLDAFVECLEQVPLASIEYHQARNDFAAWIGNTLGDGDLAGQLRKLAARNMAGEPLRAALIQRVVERIELIETLR